jgi:hypothetical protein
MHFGLPLLTIWIYLFSETRAQSYRYHLDTISTCTGWYDNSGDYSCVEVRDILGISPANFTRWNPSITLDVRIIFTYSPISTKLGFENMPQERLWELKLQTSDHYKNIANFHN